MGAALCKCLQLLLQVLILETFEWWKFRIYRVAFRKNVNVVAYFNMNCSYANKETCHLKNTKALS